jgi:hypothetical protein
MDIETSHIIKLYLETQMVTGKIHFAPIPGARLSDALNGITDKGPVRGGKFLELTDVTIRHADGTEENLKFSYISKATVQLAVSSGNVDSRTVTGAKNGPRAYPFVEKSPVLVRIETHDYLISGVMYCKDHQSIWRVLEDPATFLLLTDVQIRALANDIREEFSFAAVNKEQILSLRDGVSK